MHAERAQLTRREVTTGKVEIARRTTERAETLHEELANERVEIKHVPIGRVIDRMPEIRQVGDTTIVPVVEEILVTEKRLVLKEEVHLQRVRTVRTHPETVMLREQQAVITRTATADDAPASVAVDTPDIFQTKDA